MFPYLPLALVEETVPLAQARDVSRKARSRDGFVTAYRTAGDPEALPPRWQAKRHAFLSRHVAQLQARNEPLYERRGPRAGQPTRRHLALIMWAYSPDKARVRASVSPVSVGGTSPWTRLIKHLGYQGTTVGDLAHEAGLPPELLAEAVQNSAVPADPVGKAAAFLCGFGWGAGAQAQTAHRYGWTPGSRPRYSL